MRTRQLIRLKRDGEPIACLTAYDASFAAHAQAAGVDVLLVGDSLGMVVQGHDCTLPVTLDDMVYHTRAVRRGAAAAPIVADLPFMTYADVPAALTSAHRLVAEGGADMVKLEGGSHRLEAVEALAREGVAVCGHLGVLPQSVQRKGYTTQGQEPGAAQQMLDEARALEAAGAELLVLECIPPELARRITDVLTIPTIGIGAGPHCDGQVLVLYDLLGITPGRRPAFAPDYLTGRKGGVSGALKAYVRAVKQRQFPPAGA